MTESEFINATAMACRRDHKSRKTLESYTGYAARYARWLRMNPAVHTLRHSFATAYLEGGGSIHKLQELLGHTSLETTEVYTHCVQQFAADVTSPLDALRMGERKVLAFPGQWQADAPAANQQRKGVA